LIHFILIFFFSFSSYDEDSCASLKKERPLKPLINPLKVGVKFEIKKEPTTSAIIIIRTVALSSKLLERVEQTSKNEDKEPLLFFLVAPTSICLNLGFFTQCSARISVAPSFE